MGKCYKLNQMKIYHVINKSIAGFVIFPKYVDYQRFLKLIKYYQFDPILKFSEYIRLNKKKIVEFEKDLMNKEEPLVNIIAYCLMPTHIHLALQEVQPNGISNYMRKLLNSYTRYFNEKYRRKGPLWQGRFKKVEVGSDEQLLHLTRYIHLNPTSAGLVEKPEDWEYSSYREYIGKGKEKFCLFKDLLDISAQEYKEFVEDRINYQRELEKIKHLLLE